MDLLLLCQKPFTPTIFHERATQVEDTLFSLTSNMWTHVFPTTEWSMDSERKSPLRGSVEKSELFFQFLLSAFCKEGGVALDLFLGCGGALDAGAKAGVHVVGVDLDSDIIDWVKRHKG